MNFGECDFVGNSGRCMHHRHKHISQYLKFQEMLEFVGHQWFASSMIISEPPTQRKTMCLFGC